MNAIKQAATIGERGLRHLLHHPISMIFTLFTPLVWLLFFGNLFQDVTQIPGFPAESYMSYVLGGVLGILILSVSTFNASNVVFDKVSGFFAKLLSFPISRISIAMGYAIDTLTQILILVVLMLIVGLIASGGMASGWLGFILILWLSLLFGFAMTCLGLSMSLVAPTAWEFFGMVNFIELPMIFASSALFPQTFMPTWLKVVSMFNPLHYYATGVQNLIVNGLDWGQVGIATLALLVFDILFFAMVSASYRRVTAV